MSECSCSDMVRYAYRNIIMFIVSAEIQFDLIDGAINSISVRVANRMENMIYIID